MPSIYATQLLVVATGLCSALAGKALAVSLINALLLSSSNPLISVVKDSTAPPVDDLNQKETLGQYLDTHPIVWNDGKFLNTVPWLGNESSALQQIWQNGTNTFKIAIDSCVPMDATVGLYHFANGTTKNDTTLYEISQDLLEFAYSKTDGTTHRLVRFASQTIVNAQLALNEIEAFLDNHVVCGNVTVSGTDRNELRRLLVQPDDPPDGYWATLGLQCVIVALNAGLIVAIATAIDDPSIRVIMNITLASFFCFITGVLIRAQRNGRMNYADALLGSVVSALIRREVELAAGIGTIDACNSDNGADFDAVSPQGIEGSTSLRTSYESAMSVFDLDHPAQGPQCSS